MKQPDKPTAIRSACFRNYKGLQEFALRLRHMNVLVGPNNSGKSTILSAFRILDAGIRLARSRRPDVIELKRKRRYGYKIKTSDLPFSFENVHTNLSDADTNIDFELGNSTHLQCSVSGQMAHRLS